VFIFAGGTSTGSGLDSRKGHLCAVSQRGSAGINPGIMQVSKLHCSRHRQHSPLAYDMACSMCNIEAGEHIDEGVRYEQLC